MTKDDLPPVPDPYWMSEGDRKSVEEKIQAYALQAIAAHDAKRMDTCHPYWETASREELLDTLKFQGATTRALLAELDEKRAHDAKRENVTALLRELLDASVEEVKAKHSLDVARRNFTSWAIEERTLVDAMIRISNAEKAARAYIEREGA